MWTGQALGQHKAPQNERTDPESSVITINFPYNFRGKYLASVWLKRSACCETFYESHPKAQLLWGLQKHGVPLVPPPQLFPQDLQLAEELLNLGAAWMLCSDQPPALLRKQCSTDEGMWWLWAVYVTKYRPNLKFWVTKAVSDEMSARYLLNTHSRPVEGPGLQNVRDIFIQGIHPVLVF